MKKGIQSFLENKLSEEGENKLLNEVKADEKLSAEVYSQLQMDESLNSFFDEDNEAAVDLIMKEVDKSHGVDQVMRGVKEFERKKNRRRFTFSLAACAALLLCSFLIPYYLNDQTAKALPPPAISEQFINVPAGKLIKQTFENGVQVSIKGPAKYLVDSSMLVKLDQGYLLANVSKSASGFTVITPEGVIRDISTKFSVKVQEGKTDLEVLKGEVEVRLHNEIAFTKVRELEKVSIFAKTISPSESFDRTGDTISINFGGFAEVSGKTGAKLVGNWNNVGAPITPMPLEDNTGEPLLTTVQLSDSTVWKADYVKGNSQSSNLFLGRLMGGQVIGEKEAVEPLEISLKEIPYKKYDIYVYYWQGRSNDKHAFTLQSNDGPKYVVERHRVDSAVSESTFSKWQGEGENRSGNYFAFENLEGANVLIKAAMSERKDVHRQWHISGLQIISRD